MAEKITKPTIRKFFSKAVLIFIGVIALLGLLTPLSVLRVNKKVTEFIQKKARQEIVQLEKELGLKIHWEKLHFKVLDFSINLEGISLERSPSRAFKKPPLSVFLDGTQYAEKIFLRPSLFFLFKKRVFFSKIELQGGRFFIEIAERTSIRRSKKLGKRSNFKVFQLPFKKILIKDTDLYLKQGIHSLALSGVKWNIKNKMGTYFFASSIKEIHLEENEALSFRIKGSLSDRHFSLDECVIKNDSVHIRASRFSGSFNNKKQLEDLVLESQGELPFESLKPWLSLINKDAVDYSGPVSYKLFVEKKGRKGVRGRFDIQSKEGLLLQKIPLKELSLKGYFHRNFLVVNKGFVNIGQGSLIKIQKAELLLKEKTLPFQFSILAEDFSVDLLKKIIRNEELPLAASAKGSLKCKGRLAFSEWECQSQFQTPELTVYAGKTDIVRFYDMNADLDLQNFNDRLNITVKAEKQGSTDLQMSLVYSFPQDKTLIKLDGYTNFSKDTYFPSVNLKGNVAIRNGLFEIKNKKFKGSGQLQSDFLQIENYQINNIQSLFRYSENKMYFTNLKAGTDKSSYSGSALFDFEKEFLTLDLSSPFFYTEELLFILKKKNVWPLQTSGTGTTSFFLKYHFKDPLKNEIKLKGNLFNTRFQKEFFPNISFDISSLNGKGHVHFIKLKKNAGEVDISGTFDSRFDIHLDINGSHLALERMQSISALLPFNQSGVVNFKLKAEGPLAAPSLKGDIQLSETALYTYPVKDSKLKIAVNKAGFSLSGHIMEEIHLKQFSWPFSKKGSVYLKGDFLNWDFIKARMAHSQKESIEESFSKAVGRFDLSIKKGKSYRGVVAVDDFKMQKNSQWIKNQKPFRLIFRDSEWLLSPVNFEDAVGRQLKVRTTNDDNLLISGNISLEFLSFLFPIFQQLKGQAKVYLKNHKNLEDFSPEGWISITEGGITLNPLPAIRNISSLLSIRNKKISFENFTGFSGAGTVTGKGFLIYDFKESPFIDTFFRFEDITLNIPKDFSTTGNGVLNIKGEKSFYSLTGQYVIKEGLIKKEFSKQQESEEDLFANYSFLKGKTKTESSPMNFDIQIETLKPLLVKNTFIEASIKGGSQIYGPMNHLLMKGGFDILPDTGHLVFKDQEFKITSGKISFDESPPDNPFLRVNAQTFFSEKVIDTTEGLQTDRETVREYNIFLNATGPAKEMVIFLESFPPLSEKEIISMLTLGVGSRYFDTKVKENITQYSYQLIGSLLLRQPLSREIRDRFGLELGINPHINIKKNEPVTKITLKRKWFKTLETSFSRTLEELPQSDIRLKYELSRNMALTAFWEDRELQDLEDSSSSRSKTGLDMEISFEF